MMSRGVIIIALAAALCIAGAAADSFSQSSANQSSPGPSMNIVGKWAVSQSRCEDEVLEFSADGKFHSTLDERETREGKYRLGRDRIILIDEDEPDRELALMILDYTPTRLVAFDETIESDRRLVRCR